MVKIWIFSFSNLSQMNCHAKLIETHLWNISWNLSLVRIFNSVFSARTHHSQRVVISVLYNANQLASQIGTQYCYATFLNSQFVFLADETSANETKTGRQWKIERQWMIVRNFSPAFIGGPSFHWQSVNCRHIWSPQIYAASEGLPIHVGIVQLWEIHFAWTHSLYIPVLQYSTAQGLVQPQILSQFLTKSRSRYFRWYCTVPSCPRTILGPMQAGNYRRKSDAFQPVLDLLNYRQCLFLQH